MKIKSLIIGILLGATLAGAALFALYYTARGEGDWLEYVENTLLPNAVTAVAAVFAVNIGVRPTMKNVVDAASGFLSAEKSVASASERNAKTDEKIAESERKFTEQNAASAEKIEKLEGEMLALSKRSEKMIEMMKLGFGNMDELVKKGTARNIYKVDEENEEK